jgi:hypothetical protein
MTVWDENAFSRGRLEVLYIPLLVGIVSHELTLLAACSVSDWSIDFILSGHTIEKHDTPQIRDIRIPKGLMRGNKPPTRLGHPSQDLE